MANFYDPKTNVVTRQLRASGPLPNAVTFGDHWLDVSAVEFARVAISLGTELGTPITAQLFFNSTPSSSGATALADAIATYSVSEAGDPAVIEIRTSIIPVADAGDAPNKYINVRLSPSGVIPSIAVMATLHGIKYTPADNEPTTAGAPVSYVTAYVTSD